MRHAVCLMVLLVGAVVASAQEEIVLRPDLPPGEEWFAAPSDHSRRQYPNEKWVRNVRRPTLEVYPSEHPNGTAVIVAPGGGFERLMINHEGRDVAPWLTERGVTAFVLRYRVDTNTAERRATTVEDGLLAIETVRKRAPEWRIDPGKIGIMGFSAGGWAAVGAALSYAPSNRPDFAVPIYAAMPSIGEVPDDAPPLFIAVAYDDRPYMVKWATGLMDAWRAAERRAELHVFSDGGHGFGMMKSGKASDQWLELFEAWMERQGLL